MSRSRRRPGFVLNLALCFLFLLGLFAASYFAYVRHQTALSQKILAEDAAYYLALGGANAALSYFDDPKCPSPLKRMLRSRTPAELEGQHEELPSESPPLAGLLRSLPVPDTAVQVELMLLAFRPFASPDPDSGVLVDPVEKKGSLRITATGRFQGATRRLVVFKEVRVVAVLPYVVSKFTLFVRGRTPAQALNRIRWKKIDLKTGTAAPDNVHAPLFLRNGPGRQPEENGWVFLGGGPHHLNLTWGETRWGEQAHVLKKPWQILADPAGGPGIAPGFEELVLHRGFFVGIKGDTDIFTHYPLQLPADEPVGEECALLRPYGGGADLAASDPDLDASPTYVLGQVYRRYLQLRYVRKTSTGAVDYLPFAQPADWEPAGGRESPWTKGRPPRPFDTKQEVFRQDYGVYAQHMSNVVQESYNRAFDYMQEPQELSPPMHLLEPVRVKHSLGLPDFLYDPKVNIGRVVISTRERRKLFDGYLHRFVPEDLRIPERAVERLAAARFPDWLRRRPSRLPGIVYFRGGGITIDQPLTLESGGIIAADGGIVIEAPVTSGAAGAPLSLISLGGDITVKSPGMIEASLVALSGTVKRAPGAARPLTVHGNVVARELDYPALCRSSAPGKIVYDQRLDPTVGDARLETSYAIAMPRWRTCYTPPVD